MVTDRLTQDQIFQLINAQNQDTTTVLTYLAEEGDREEHINAILEIAQDRLTPEQMAQIRNIQN